jgi:1-acyl-sn-glycerol-3-phosphate acyltransferase
MIFFSNHSSHLDATLIMTTLPDEWQARTAVGAARDYFFDVWWRQAFTALVYGGFPIDRARGGRGATDKARELMRDGWSLVVFPEGTRSTDGNVQRFRHGAARLAIEMGVGLEPIAIVGAFQAMPKGRSWPRPGRLPVTVRYGRPIVPEEGETHQDLSRRMAQAVAQLFDEDRTTWWESLRRAELGETPSLAGPVGPSWRRRWEGSRPVPRRGPPRTWE